MGSSPIASTDIPLFEPWTASGPGFAGFSASQSRVSDQLIAVLRDDLTGHRPPEGFDADHDLAVGSDGDAIDASASSAADVHRRLFPTMDAAAGVDG